MINDLDMTLAKQIIADYVERMDTVRQVFEWDDDDPDLLAEMPENHNPDEWVLIARTEEGAEHQVEVYVDYINKEIKKIYVDWDVLAWKDVYVSLQDLVSDLLAQNYEDLVIVSRWDVAALRRFSKRLMRITLQKGVEAGKEYMLRTYPKVRRHKRKAI